DRVIMAVCTKVQIAVRIADVGDRVVAKRGEVDLVTLSPVEVLDRVDRGIDDRLAGGIARARYRAAVVGDDERISAAITPEVVVGLVAVDPVVPRASLR